MAGRGPAPKPPEARRNRTPPARGEWVDLPAVEAPVLPALPEGEWHPRTVAMYSAWSLDPAATQFGPAEVAAVLELAYLLDAHVCGDREAKAAEVRLRMDGLGLSAKGKRDLRWRAPTETAAQQAESAAPSKGTRRRHLRAVDPAG